jgi:hypothetical protein
MCQWSLQATTCHKNPQDIFHVTQKDIIILHQQWGLFPCNLQLMFYDVLRVYAFLSFLKSSSSVLYKTGQRRKCSLHWEEAMAELNPLESQV